VYRDDRLLTSNERRCYIAAMARRSAIVIAVDGLRASALGAYGNAAQAMPAIDELASQSVVVDWMLCTSPELSAFYDAALGDPPLTRGIVTRGGAATLITDDPAVAAWGDDAGFQNVLLVELPTAGAANSISETSLARLFAVATELIVEGMGDGADETPASLYWIHARGLCGAWDAPPELRASQLDEGDPAPPNFTTPPAAEHPTDHDALLGFQVAYAAQIVVLDECIAGFRAAVNDLGLTDESLIVFVGSSGFALGEHGLIGSEDRRLFSERLHVPCLLRAPGAAPAPPRWSSLATPHDLHATLACWLEGHVESETSDGANLLAADPPLRKHVLVHGREGERAVRTHQWMLRVTPAPAATYDSDSAPTPLPKSIELYVKPDDRWEANEVSALCPDDVDELTAMLRGESG
jgi:arylsulfatase A-like enzyme